MPDDPRDALRPSLPRRLAALEGRLHAFDAEGPLAARLDSLERVVAIVGTRRPGAAAIAFARSLAFELASRGAVVVSGGAVGIDTAAHEGALDAGGATIAVFAGGLDVEYPRENRPIFAAIRARGAVVAVQPRGTPPLDWMFLHRNEVIAALADHVVLVAAPLKSGARSTVGHARKLGRTVWVVPGAPWEEQGAGCALELAVGGNALDSSARLLAALDLAPALALPRIQPPVTRDQASPLRALLAACSSDAERDVARRFANRPVSLDEIALDGTLPVGALRALLLTWTVEGLVREAPPGVFFLARR
ncbi:MAG: DNA-processing protein DprA [Polyangiales bacterium]